MASKRAKGEPVRATYALWAGSDLFSHEALRSLLDEPLRVSATGGARSGSRGGQAQYNLKELVELAKQNLEHQKPLGKAIDFVDAQKSMPRERNTRWDVKLKQHWVNRMRQENVAFDKMCRMAEYVKQGDARCGKAKAAWHVQRVSPGSEDQGVHADDEGKRARCYYTLIVPLVDNPLAGGTHFPDHGHTFSEYGGALVFDGRIRHLGLGNRSTVDRYFLYAAIYTGSDDNSD